MINYTKPDPVDWPALTEAIVKKIGRSRMAEICEVTRASIYDWTRKGIQPKYDTGARVIALAKGLEIIE